jgi:branched-chain amino acid transport system substrate-binding protein
MTALIKLATAMSVALAAALAPAQAQETIKIGGIAPLSPPGGVQTGESLRDGMIIAVEELNAEGGLMGKQVELIVEDTSGVPEKGVAAFQRLARSENVVAVTGSAHSAVCAAVGPVAQETNTVFIAGECWSDSVTAAQIPQVFRVTVANSLVYSVARRLGEGSRLQEHRDHFRKLRLGLRHHRRVHQEPGEDRRQDHLVHG